MKFGKGVLALVCLVMATTAMAQVRREGFADKDLPTTKAGWGRMVAERAGTRAHSPASAVPAGGASHVSPAQAKRIAQQFAAQPLSFEPNEGQTDARARFLARGAGYTLFLGGADAVLALHHAVAIDRTDPESMRSLPPPTVVGMTVAGANPRAESSGVGLLPGKSNYFIGNDRTKWRSNVAHYSQVRYHDIYRGVDLVYYGKDGELEYDFVVSPGAKPSLIALDFAGAKKLSVEGNGDLLVTTAAQPVRLHKPVVYQSGKQGREVVDGRYVLLASNRVGFKVGKYDSSRELVIDPVLVYSTYFGGSVQDFAQAITADAIGNAYITGYTFSATYPVSGGAVQASCASCNGAFGDLSDAFVTKLDPNGGLVFSTFLGGNGSDFAFGIALDASNNVYLTGQTFSGNFPLAGSIAQNLLAGTFDAFMTELNSSGSALIQSTYLGGSGQDIGSAIGVDGSGNVYISGITASRDFPTTDTGVIEFSPPAIGVYQSFPNSTSSGVSWQFASNGMQMLDVRALAVMPSTATSAATVYAGGSGLVYKSTDNGASWNRSSNGINSVPVHSLAVDTGNPNIVIAGAFFGVYRSTDAGNTWANVFNPGANVITLAISPTIQTDFGPVPATVYAGTDSNGVFKSLDGGATWFAVQSGLPSGMAVDALAVDPNNANNVYAGTTLGQGQMFQSTNGGSGWVQLNAGLPQTTGLAIANVLSIAIDPTTSEVFAGLSGGNGVWFLSGNTWQTGSFPLGHNARSMVIAPDSNPNQPNNSIYAGTGAAGVFASTDGGNTWALTGQEQQLNFSTVRALAVDSHSPTDIFAGEVGFQGFVSAFNSSGGLSYSTYFGGQDQNTEILAMSVDASGNSYLTGFTTSPTFPQVNPVTPVNGQAFLSELDPKGSTLVHSTPFGGSFGDVGFAVAVDSGGNAYVAGNTSSGDFPVTAGVIQGGNFNGNTGFITKFNSTGGLAYSTFFGGSASPFFGPSFDQIFGINVDSGGDAFFVMDTNSINLPLANPLQTFASGFEDMYVGELDPNGASLLFGTYLGGENFQTPAVGVGIDGQGNLLVGGYSGSVDFPVYSSTAVPPFQSALNNTNAINNVFTKISLGSAANNPVPTIGGFTVLVSDFPDSNHINGLPIVVTGSNFVPGSQVLFGLLTSLFPVTTRFVNSNELRAYLQCDCSVTNLTQYSVAVTNPAPGGGQSNILTQNIIEGTFSVQVLQPMVAPGGSKGMTLAVQGNNFVPGVTVRWNGSNRPTTYISGTQLSAAITAADLAMPGMAAVSVMNPANGISSNAVNFTVADFKPSISPGNITVKTGQPATFSIAVAPQYGSFDAAVSFSCENLPAGASCVFSPASVVPGTNTATVTLTVSTSGMAAAPFARRRPIFAFWLGLPMLGIVMLGAGRSRRKVLWLAAGLVLLSVALVGCGGGGGSQFQQQTQTPSGPSATTFTVHAAAGSLSHDVTGTFTRQ